MEEDLTDYDDEGEDEDDIHGGIDGATLGNEVWQLSHWHEFQVCQLMIWVLTPSLLILMTMYQSCAAGSL